MEEPCFDVNSACTAPSDADRSLLDRMAADSFPPFVLITQPEGITTPSISATSHRRSCSATQGSRSSATVIHRWPFLVETQLQHTAWSRSLSPRLPFPPGRSCRPGVRHPPMTESLQGLKAAWRMRGVSGSSATRRTLGRFGPSVSGWESRTSSTGTMCVTSEHGEHRGSSC